MPYLGKEGETIGSDWPYAREPGTPEIVINLPRYAIGRIPVDTLTQANDVVDKIINYAGDFLRVTSLPELAIIARALNVDISLAQEGMELDI